MLKNAEKTEIAELSREISDYAKKLRALGRNPKKADLFLIDVKVHVHHYGERFHHSTQE